MSKYMQKIDLKTAKNKKEEKTIISINKFIDNANDRGYKVVNIFNRVQGGKPRKFAETICPNGNKYIARMDKFNQGSGCGCGCKKDDINTKRREVAIKNFHELLEYEGYTLIDEYVNAHTKIRIKCNNSHIYKTKPSVFKEGCRCPYCNIVSHGEEKAAKILKDNNIKFEREKMFDNLVGVGGGMLRFDFYLPQHNAIIEVQGEGHFEEYRTDFLRKTTIENDKIKRKFCKDKNVKLYEIEYLQDKYGFKKALEKVEEKVLEIIKEIAE